MVGDGASISFWHDNWVYPFPLADVLPISPGMDRICVHSFISLSNSWDVELLRGVVPEYVLLDISEIFIPSSVMADKQVWGLSPDGVYSVRLGARLAQDHVKFLWIWDLPIPPKIKFFLWKICMDGLPTKTRLEKSHVFFFSAGV